MLKKPQLSLSQKTLIFIVLYWAFSTNITHKYRAGRVFKHDDVLNYYIYLPSLFVHGDMTMEWTGKPESQFERDSKFIYVFGKGSPLKVPRMTMGMAILYSPFFLIAHFLSWISGVEMNGYNGIYSYLLGISTFFYGIMGLVFTRKILKRYFNENVIALTLITLACATNLQFYGSQKVGMSHSASYFLIAAFTYCTIIYYDRQRWRGAVVLGLLLGLITLVRPVNLLIALFPIIYGSSRLGGIGNNLKFFIQQWKALCIITICVFLVALPQLLFWKYTTGHFMYNSYEDQVFRWAHPHLLDGLFSYRKGWLLYTPIMTLSLIGMFFLRKQCREMSVVIPVVIGLVIYVMFSWWCWWYGGAFGCRPIIDYFGLLAIPLAAFLSSAILRKVTTYVMMTVIVFFSFLNFFQSMQYDKGIIHGDGMTKDAYWSVFLRMSKPKNYEHMLDIPDYENSLKIEE